MAERKLKGVDMLLYIDLANTQPTPIYSLVVCLTSQALGIQNAIIDAATKCGPDSQPGKQTNSASFDGQIMLAPASLRVSALDLYNAAQDRTTFAWKMAVATPVTGEDVIYTGQAFLSDFNQTFDLDNPASFSATMGIIGSVTATLAP